MWSKVTSTKYWDINSSTKPEAFKSIKPNITIQPILCILITDTVQLAGEEDRTSVAKLILDLFI